MAKIKATIGGVAYEINAVKGITANNTEINVPLTIDGEGGGVGGLTEYKEVSISGASLSLETIPISPTSYQGYKVAHGLTSTPKLVIMTSNAPGDDTLKSAIIGGYFSNNGPEGYNVSESKVRKLGVIFQTNSNTGTANGFMVSYGTENDKVSGWGGFGMDDTYFYFTKTGNAYAVNSSLTYTFKFFA